MARRTTRSSVKAEAASPPPAAMSPAGKKDGTKVPRASSSKAKVKGEAEDDTKPDGLATPPPSPKKAASSSQAAKKLASLAMFRQTPFPDYERPTADECQNVHDLLSSVHGTPKRPEKLTDKPRAGCGDTPDVLDALIRTVLSANTTSRNSTAAKMSMDERYGRANHRAVLEAPVEDLRDAIQCGGLANIKSKRIHKILQSVDEKQGGKGQLSLDYLHDMSDLDVMRELLSFDGIGPKTASCVLLFCLGRESFAVDTHVFRISMSLGWLPKNATRETAFQHLDVRIPDNLKYGLHSLLVRHGRGCVKCSANGVTSMEVVKSCPIDHLVRRTKGKHQSPASSKTKKRSKTAVKAEEDEEEAAAEEEDEDVKQETGTPTRKAKRSKIDASVNRDEAEMGGHAFNA